MKGFRISVIVRILTWFGRRQKPILRLLNIQLQRLRCGRLERFS
jgi:hypothetical protein